MNYYDELERQLGRHRSQRPARPEGVNGLLRNIQRDLVPPEPGDYVTEDDLDRGRDLVRGSIEADDNGKGSFARSLGVVKPPPKNPKRSGPARSRYDRLRGR